MPDLSSVFPLSVPPLEVFLRGSVTFIALLVRRSSRPTVEGERPSRPAMSRTPSPARRLGIRCRPSSEEAGRLGQSRQRKSTVLRAPPIADLAGDADRLQAATVPTADCTNLQHHHSASS